MAKKLIRFDWAMKKMLRHKVNFDILEGFLSELLGEEVTIKQVLDSESNKETEDDKFNRVDILVENEKGELVIIEVQNTQEHDYFHRMLFGASKAITEHIKEGSAYANVKKVISITIAYFDLGQGKDYVYHGTNVFKGIHKGDILGLSDKQVEVYGKNNVREIYPEYYIIKTGKFRNRVNDKLDEWIYFFKNSEVLDEFRAKGMSEVREKLNVMNLPDDERKKYNKFLESLHDEASYAETMKIEAEEAAANAARKVEDEFREDERKKEKLDTAKKSIKMGFTNEQISAITDLPIDEIERLRK